MGFLGCISIKAQHNFTEEETIDGLSDIGFLANNLGYYDLAIHAFSEALAIDSTNLFCIANRAFSYHGYGNYQTSILEYTKAIDIMPYHLFYNIRGLSYEEMGEYKKALTDFENAISINDSTPHSYYNKGRILLHFEKTDKAITFHQKALDLVEREDERADILNSLGKIYFEIEDYENSLKCFLDITYLNQATSYTHSRIGDIYRRTDKIEKSIDAYTVAIDTFDYVEPLAYLYRAKMNIIHDFEQWPKSIEDILKYIELSPEDPIGYETYGGLLYMTQDDSYCDYLKIACEKGSCDIYYEICK